MTETSRTAEQVVSSALRRDRLQTTEHLEGAQIAINALRGAGLLRTPAEPSEEQIERAAKVVHANYEDHEWDDENYSNKHWAITTVRAAFKAAAVTPQPVGDETYLVTIKLPKNPDHNPRAKVTGTCPVSASCTDTTGEHHTYLTRSVDEVMAERRHVTRIEKIALAPQSGCCTDDTNVLDVSMTQVGQATLAEVMRSADRRWMNAVDRNNYDPRVYSHPGDRTEYGAKAVAAWLKGGAR